MTMTKNDALIQVVLDRFVNRRLPRILDLRKKVKRGELLNEMDISFFNKVMKDNRENKHLKMGLLNNEWVNNRSLGALPLSRWAYPALAGSRGSVSEPLTIGY